MRPRVKTTELSELSVAVAELRKALGLTQQQFAQRLGTSITTVARWETTGRSPSGSTLLRLRVLAQRQWQKARDERLRDLMDVFHSALVDEFPILRQGLSIGLQVSADRLREAICELSAVLGSPEWREKLDVMGQEVEHIRRAAEMLSPVNYRLPLKASSGDVQAIWESMPDPFGGRFTATAADVILRHRHRGKRTQRE
jgi:transcriptional regulator with XRE-family HTH domain